MGLDNLGAGVGSSGLSIGYRCLLDFLVVGNGRAWEVGLGCNFRSSGPVVPFGFLLVVAGGQSASLGIQEATVFD